MIVQYDSFYANGSSLIVSPGQAIKVRDEESRHGKGRPMVRRVAVLADKGRKLAVIGAGALALTGAVLAFAAGTANADVVNIGGKPNPVLDANPAPEGGVRTTGKGVANAGPSDVRRSREGAPLPPAGGEVKDSIRAVPPITGGIGTHIRTGPARNRPGLADW